MPDDKYTIGKENTFLIWDSDGSPPVGDWKVILWRDYAEVDVNTISIPILVEEQAEKLRNQYLAWIYDLGETYIKGNRVVDHLALRPGFSYWWMTSLAQKFNASGNSQANNAIKAFVLESLVSEHQPQSIILISNNNKLAKTLKYFCRKLKVKFKLDFVEKSIKSRSFVSRLYEYFPYPLQALIFFLRYCFKNFSLLKTKQTSKKIEGEISFIDVLAHLDDKVFSKKYFISNYWTTLVDELLLLNVKTNWFHNYFYQKSIPSPIRAQQLLGDFNKSSNNMQSHMLMEASLSLSNIIEVIKIYLCTFITSIRLSNIKYHFSPTGSVLNLWPLFKDEWIESLRGPTLISQCLRISFFEKTFMDIPKQKTGVYIQENQPWELALIYAWKKAGHGQLIGVPHTAVRFWDLRYFYDYRSYVRKGKNLLPMPDLVAINGSVAKENYLDGRYPKTQLKEVEALRFMSLLKGNTVKSTSISPDKELNILVCGDFLSASSEKMLSWLDIAAKLLPDKINYIFKPHPAYPLNVEKYTSLTLTIKNNPLIELFNDCDVVFASNTTSAAVDAYCSGIPVIQMLDGSSFNMSPLRGLEGVVYVRNPKELHNALSNVHHEKNVMHEPYFYLDENLHRWKKILDINPVDTIY